MLNFHYDHDDIELGFVQVSKQTSCNPFEELENASPTTIPDRKGKISVDSLSRILDTVRDSSHSTAEQQL